MKRIALLGLLLTPALALAHNHKTTSTTTTTTTKTTQTAAAGAQYEINVDGMHCESCVDNLTKQLEAMTDVEKGSVKVDLKGNKATVTLKKAGMDTAAMENLKKSMNTKLSSAGFTVTGMKVVN